MQSARSGARPLRVLTDVFVSDDGPSGIGVLAANTPSPNNGSIYEQAFGKPEELSLLSVLQALKLGKNLNAERICVLCPDEITVKIVNRETPLQIGSPLAPTYMSIRALIYTYQKAEVRAVSRSRVRPARELAIAASRLPVRSSNPQFELFALAG